jgi:hypothetical protein
MSGPTVSPGAPGDDGAGTPDDGRPPIIRWIAPVALMLVSLGLLAYFLAPYRHSIRTSLDRASLESLLALTALSCCAMALRTEAWRVCLGAAGRHPPHSHLHAANAGTFAVGLANHYLAPWVKILMLRRMEGEEAAQILQLAAIDLAGGALEVFAAAALLVFTTFRLGLPWWVPALFICGALGVVVVAAYAQRRYPDHPVIQGLRVLLRRGYRGRVILVFVLVFAVQITRTWIALHIVGLHGAGFDDAVLVFVVTGVFGALPSGLTAAPIAASLVVVGSKGVGAAAGVGVLLTATLALATVIYALAGGLLFARARQRRLAAA